MFKVAIRISYTNIEVNKRIISHRNEREFSQTAIDSIRLIIHVREVEAYDEPSEPQILDQKATTRRKA
jgi:hypothetical protein